MADQNSLREHLKGTAVAMLSETFEQVQGIYLDRGTSLFETLAGMSAEQASQPLSSQSGSIAAKVDHMRIYLGSLEAYMLHKPEEPIDWPATWRRQVVTADEWAELIEQLRAAYQHLLGLLHSVEASKDGNEIGGAFAAAIHTAYHLGEIRQALGSLRS